MKRILSILTFCLLAAPLFSQVSAPVTYKTADQVITPTNLLSSNILASAGVNLAKDAKGRLTISVNASNPVTVLASANLTVTMTTTNGTNFFAVSLATAPSVLSLYSLYNYVGALDVTNGIRFETALVAGTGGANTNFTLFSTNADTYINGFTNVSIRAVYGSASGKADYWNLTITNGSGQNNTVEFSAVTNRFRFAGTYGTNAPTVLTNNTALEISCRQDGSNVLVGYTYFAWP